MRAITYFLILILFTATIWTISWFITSILAAPDKPGLVPFQFTYFTLLTGGIHMVLSRYAGGRPIRFVNAYMLASTIKLLMSLTIILVVSWNKPVPTIPFVVHFASLYLVYTIFEISLILRVLRPGKKD